MLRDTDLLIDCTTPLRRIRYRHVGGKGWNLFLLRRYGFSVPSWCVISSRAFDLIVGLQRSGIAELLVSTDYSSQESVEQASTTIGALIQTSFANSSVREAIDCSLREWHRDGGHFAVRSSIVGEDSQENSFAGLMDSYLNVSLSGVLEKILLVWSSAFSPRALAYRHHKGLSLTDISAGVIVQRMVDSEKSGVLFTRNPDSGEAQCVISAGFGVGEGVVSNHVETDTYRAALESNEITKEVAHKLLRTVADDNHMNGTRLEELPHHLQSNQVLTDPEILWLRDLAICAEKHFQIPQDIEWAIDSSGALAILQSRPIVFADRRKQERTVRIWDNSNIVESYPGLTLPLTFSFIRRAYEETFSRLTRSFFFSKRAIGSDAGIFRNMIGLIEGRVYYNLLNWYRMLSHLPGFEKHKKSWDQMIGISQKIPFPQTQHTLLTRAFSLMIVVYRLLTVARNARRFFKRFDRVHRRYLHADVSKREEDEIIALHESLCEELSEFWHLTLVNDLAAMKYYDWLKTLCTTWINAENENLHNNLLCGESGVESVKPVRSIVRIAEMVRANPEWARLMSLDDHDVWENIHHNEEYSRLRDALDEHLELCGDRGLEELKLERTTFREQPESLIGLTRQYYQIGLSVEEMERQEQRVRTRAEMVVRKDLKGVLKRLVFSFVLKNARRAVVNRENMRFARTRVYGIVRRFFRRLGELFEQKGIVASRSDLYYLTVDEAFGYTQGASVTQDLMTLTEIRKREYETFARRVPDERIQTQGIPYLNVLCKDDSSVGRVKELRGIGCSSGVAEGEARVVLDPRSVGERAGQILVARSTDPGWVFLMISSKGIVVEKGSVLSHTAIIGRELGIPTVVGVKQATKLINDGATVCINGSTGVVQWR